MALPNHDHADRPGLTCNCRGRDGGRCGDGGPPAAAPAGASGKNGAMKGGHVVRRMLANGRPHALRIAGEKCAVPFSSRGSKANHWLSSTVQAAPHRTVEVGAATYAAPLSFGCAMLPCWTRDALQARHSSDADFQTKLDCIFLPRRRDLVSLRDETINGMPRTVIEYASVAVRAPPGTMSRIDL
jgi:hypothetical protein